MRELRSRYRLIFGVLLLVGLTACGSATKKGLKSVAVTSPGIVAMRARLSQAGYTARNNIATAGLHPRPEQAFSLDEVDFTSPHSFSVAVYAFPSAAAARGFGALVAAKLDPLAKEFPKSFAVEHALKVVGAHVYFAFTESDPTICPEVGLCASYPNVGTAQCSSVAGSMQCVLPPAVPVGVFDKVVATAERR
jgi:hypothetical protein